MSGLKILPKKVNDNKRKAKEMVKYLKVMRHFGIDYDQSEFICNKYYREEMMKNVDDNNYREKYVDFELENLEDFDEEEIQEDIEGAQDIEDEEEQIDDEDDVNGNVTEEPESEGEKKYKQMLKYLLIILYYNLKINTNKFITDESYMEEKIKEESFKEHLKKFDEEENVEIEGFEFVDKKVQINFKGQLSRKFNYDYNVINNSIEAIAEEIPVVVNNNELKVTESKVKKKERKEKKV
jgi:hypothetical protein